MCVGRELVRSFFGVLHEHALHLSFSSPVSLSSFLSLPKVRRSQMDQITIVPRPFPSSILASPGYPFPPFLIITLASTFNLPMSVCTYVYGHTTVLSTTLRFSPSPCHPFPPSYSLSIHPLRSAPLLLLLLPLPLGTGPYKSRSSFSTRAKKGVPFPFSLYPISS